MAIRNIVLEGDPVLNKVCRKVEKFDEKLHLLLDDMKETMHDADGVGLAAPQIGILKRIFVIDIGFGVIEFINPQIIETEGEVCESEGCLSIPGIYGTVRRPEFVTVKAQNRFGEEFTMTRESGLFARAICHENDHLDGILFNSKVEEFDN